MPKGKASGPNGLPIEFYQTFWPIVKADVLDLIKESIYNSASIKYINRAAIILLPKKTNPKSISDYIPISVINTIVKIIPKIMVNRLQSHLPQLVLPNQMAFVKGR